VSTINEIILNKPTKRNIRLKEQRDQRLSILD